MVMESILVFPENRVLSYFVLWLASVILLWAARQPMQELIARLGKGLDGGLASGAAWCHRTAESLRNRGRAALLAAGTLDTQRRLDREFERIDHGFSDKLEQYAKLHRRLDDTLQSLDEDYRSCGDSPPEVPGWTAAASAVAQIPTSGDPNANKVLDGIRRSSQEAEKRALASYKEATAKRHTVLGRMAPVWKEIRTLMSRMLESVGTALESTARIDGYYDEYRSIRDEQEKAARALSFSAVKLFVVSLVVLGIAVGGAFINFQLIALPMSELVPAGARIGGVPVSTVSALLIVLMEAAIGIFLMDMLGITDLLPKLNGIPSSKRRLILFISVAGLFFLASVESSLAVLREQIVEADAALKLALAGEEGSALGRASSSNIPVIGQAVLGFVLPWVLAMVAIPLEMLIDSSRHVINSLVVFLLHAAGHLSHVAGRLVFHAGSAVNSLYDVYIAVPLRIEQAWTGRDGGGGGGSRPRTKRKELTGEVPV
jgi:hypothetical protein